ncbi:MAG: hypothetical protein U1A78_33765 [Polyangia bacterium]
MADKGVDGAALGRGLASALAGSLNKVAYAAGEVLDAKVGGKGVVSHEISSFSHNVFQALQDGGVLPRDKPLPPQLPPTAWVKAAVPALLGAGALFFLLGRLSKPKVIEVRRG